jgi:hypothetical protein
MDRRVYPCRVKYIQKSKSFQHAWVTLLSDRPQMWVSAEEYQEDPDIIHKKFGF